MSMTAEQELSNLVDTILSDRLQAEYARSWPSPKLLSRYRQECARFTDWMDEFGVSSVTGHIVAGYVLERASDGAPLSDLALTADAIAFWCGLNRAYLDPQPIKAALALVAAQIGPHRVLN